jgi:hypothetical protein
MNRYMLIVCQTPGAKKLATMAPRSRPQVATILIQTSMSQVYRRRSESDRAGKARRCFHHKTFSQSGLSHSRYIVSMEVLDNLGGKTVVVVGMVVGVLVAATALAACGGAQRTSVDRHLAAHLRSAQRFTGFPLYWDGMRVGKLALTGVYEAPEHMGEAFTFIYGTCVESGDEGTCPPPLQVQVTSLCNRLPGQVGVRRLRVRMRGALTSAAEAGADNAGDVSLYVKGATITIYGSGAKLRRQAISLLQGANRLARNATVRKPLPAASRQELGGTGCQPL